MTLSKPRALPVLNRRAVITNKSEVPTSFRKACETQGLPKLIDRQGRSYTYLRISIVDRCNFACVYCMPAEGEDDLGTRSELLSFEEISRLSDVFGQMGVSRIRLTGGEPTVRKNVVALVEMIKARGIKRIAMTTNGARLSELAKPLARAGLRSVNVSLDTLCEHSFSKVTRGGSLEKVLSGIDAAIDAGLTVKINAIPLQLLDSDSDNDHQLRALVEYCWDRKITPRFIELMPLGEAARLSEKMRSSADVRTALASLLGAPIKTTDDHSGPARYWSSYDGTQRVGFISAMSNEFCDTCNRIRITSHGEIRACLASRTAVSLRDLMRAECDDVSLAWAVHQSLFGKSTGHSFNSEIETEHEYVAMSLIGG